jgi:class 3 adenylate cyclase/tetratricopeptide (TPR) repeat protein
MSNLPSGRMRDAGPGHTIEIAHVLFTDIVGYSKLPMDEQEQLLMQLQDSVRHTSEFARAETADELIRLPTGDGMALVFFRDAEAPVRCALELSRALGNHPNLKLRMGIHSGPVYRVADINANRNVAGGGINIAQRVMDCGDAGHILVSREVAEVIGQLSGWRPMLHDLGEVEVKHGVRIHIYNLFDNEAGSAALPNKVVHFNSVRVGAESKPVQKAFRWMTVGATIVLIALAVSGWLFFSRKAHALTNKDTIVLADFTNTTGDPVFDDTLNQALAVGLAQSPFLNILPKGKVEQTLRQMTRSPNERLTPDLAREVCLRSESKAYLAGSIAALGTQFVIGLEALNCESGNVLARDQVMASGKEQVLPALSQAAAKLRSEVGESLSSVQKFDVPLEQTTTSSLEALKAYSLGGRTPPENATILCKRAVELDPNFAMAYDLLGDLYSNMREPSLAADYLKKAFDLRDRVTEREKFKITADYYSLATGELDKANQTYELWIQLYPRDSYAARADLASNLMILGQYEKSAAVTLDLLRLDPTNEAGFINLGEIYLALNRFDDARHITEQAIGMFGDFGLHVNLYALANFQGNAEAMKQQADWASGKQGVQDQMLSLESDTEAWFGKLGKARELSQQAIQSAQRSDENEPAALWQTNAAIREGLFGNADDARRNAAAAMTLARGSHDAEAQAALAYALAGDTARAKAVADDLGKRFPQDTVVQSVWLRTIRAQMEIDRKNALRGIDLLEAAVPYELGMLNGSATNSCLYPVYVRGEAYLSAQKAGAAAAEFQKILDHRGLLWNCATGPLANLGLARAYQRQGDNVKARLAYQNFLVLWKSADPEIPILIAAKSEYASLH